MFSSFAGPETVGVPEGTPQEGFITEMICSTLGLAFPDVPKACIPPYFNRVGGVAPHLLPIFLSVFIDAPWVLPKLFGTSRSATLMHITLQGAIFASLAVGVKFLFLQLKL
jgi:hypothetical protein